MDGTLQNPIYKCTIKTKKAVYNVSKILTGLTVTQNQDDLAQGVTITIPNIKDKKKYLYNNITVRDSLVLYCKTGKKYKEIFRGTIWEKITPVMLRKI